MASPDELKLLARAAYERGRRREALRRAAPVLAGAVALALLGLSPRHIAPALALAVAIAVLHVAGRGLPRAIGPGLRAGAVPMLAALAVGAGRPCGAACPSYCLPLCAAAGLLVGVWLGRVLPRRERFGVVAATLLIGGLTAAVGCLPLGLGTLAGAVIGLAVGLAPTWCWRHGHV